MHRNLQNIGKEVKYTKACATLSNFKEIIRKGIKVLHLSCHGKKGDSTNGDILLFENEFGRVHEVTYKDL